MGKSGSVKKVLNEIKEDVRHISAQLKNNVKYKAKDLYLDAKEYLRQTKAKLLNNDPFDELWAQAKYIKDKAVNIAQYSSNVLYEEYQHGVYVLKDTYDTQTDD